MPFWIGRPHICQWLGKAEVSVDGLYQNLLRPCAPLIVAVALACLFDTASFERISEATARASFSVFMNYFSWVMPKGQESNDAKIGVILLDQPSLRALDVSWPPPYYVYADTLEALRHATPPKEQENKFPAAVFLDFTLVDNRSSDQSLGALKKELTAYYKAGVPVLVAEGVSDASEAPAAKDPRSSSKMREQGNTLEFPYLKGLDKLLVPTWADSNDRFRDGARFDLVAPPENTGEASASPAMELYRVYCRTHPCTPISDVAARKRPMWLVWPTQVESLDSVSPQQTGNTASDPAHDPQRQRYSCNFKYFAEKILRHLILANADCGPFPTLGVQNAISRSPDRHAPDIKHLEGRYIFFGFNLPGFHDVVQPPMSNVLLPGTFQQAVAFQNLIRFGDKYLGETSSLPYFRLLTVDIIKYITIVFLFLIQKILGFFIKKILKQNSQKNLHQTKTPHPTIKNDVLLIKRIISFIFSRLLLFLVLELIIVAIILSFVAFYLEPVLLRVAPTNWLDILGISLSTALITFPITWQAHENTPPPKSP